VSMTDDVHRAILRPLAPQYLRDPGEIRSSIGDCHISATYDNELLSTVLESIVFAKKELRYEFLEDHQILIKGKCTD